MPYAPPSLESRALFVHATCVAVTHSALTPHGPHPPLPTLRARLSTRQRASAFNQPLSFDTYSVTDMRYMFSVRSAHALAPPSLHSRAFSPCMPLVRCR